MNQVFGLPSHPLLVHIPVVLIPVLALLATAFVSRPAWRPGLSNPVAVTAVITFAGTLLAANSGGWLKDKVDDTALVRAHADQGDQLKTIGLLFCLATLVLVVLDNAERRAWRLRFPEQWRLVALASVVTVLLAMTATVWDVRVGHSGAKAVWSDPGGTQMRLEQGVRGGPTQLRTSSVNASATCRDRCDAVLSVRSSASRDCRADHLFRRNVEPWARPRIPVRIQRGWRTSSH